MVSFRTLRPEPKRREYLSSIHLGEDDEPEGPLAQREVRIAVVLSVVTGASEQACDAVETCADAVPVGRAMTVPRRFYCLQVTGRW
ncbi:MAG: hypothetical protein AAGA54_25085 [Myxococcota bacterium]